MLDKIIKNAKIVTNEEEKIVNIGIKDGKFVSFSTGELAEAQDVIDAKENYVFPGMIDVHTHVSQKTGPVPVCDSYADASKAAAAGGTTTFLSFVFQGKGESIIDAVEIKKKLAEKEMVTDYGFHIGFTDVNETSLSELKTLVREGVSSVKAFMACGNLLVPDGYLVELMKEGKKEGAMIGVHAENESICLREEAKLEEKGTTGMEYYASSRPPYAEAEAVGRAIMLAEELGVQLYIYHLTCKEALAQVERAKKRGVRVYAETCPHYLMFTDERYLEPDSYRNLMGPPLRKEKDLEELWRGVREGYIDIISTDHCPYTVEEKSVGTEDFRRISPGIPGIEFLLRAVYSEGVAKGKISINRMLEVLCSNPAKVFGLKNKGELAIGKDADFVIFDAKEEEEITKDVIHMKSGYSLMEGMKVKGKITMTAVRGNVVYEDGKIKAEEGSGKFVKMEKR